MRAGFSRRLAAIATVWLASGAAARAADAPAAKREGDWYGYQPFASDVLAFALIATGAYVGSRIDSASVGLGIGVPGAALYLAGGPLIRASHGDAAGATHSLLRRVLLPVGGAVLAGGIAALATPSGRSDVCNDQRTCAALLFGVGGFGAGMIAAALVDAVSTREPASPAEARAGPTMMPVAAVVRGGAVCGLHLAF